MLRTLIAQLRANPRTEPLLGNLRLGVNGTELRAIVYVDAPSTAMLISMLKVK